MRLASPLLKRAVYPALHHTGWFNHSMPPGGFAVVNYHGVIPGGHSSDDPFLDGHLIAPDILREQLRFLKAHYSVIEPEKFREFVELGRPLPPRAVLITCDDGLDNPLTEMLTVLQEEKVPCLFFVTAASCREDPGMLWFEELYQLMRRQGSSNPAPQFLPESASDNSAKSFQDWWWSAVRAASRFDAETRAIWMQEFRVRYGALPSEFEKRYRLLNLFELKRLSDAGMSIGAHTCTHPILAASNDQNAYREIHEGKLRLERVTGKPVWALAYPFGNPSTMGEREFRLARQAGYSCAFLNVEHWEGQQMNPFALCRTHVTSKMSLPELAAHLSGMHARLQRAVGPKISFFRKRSADLNCKSTALVESL
ncbi:MAG TPA: polysaccharide deacetylase family protein [Candidatus Sulfotelmatobacter sp.]|jgi:peptidoglycan/xylan/chitin deacetylase (PgdA/CDA1 family)